MSDEQRAGWVSTMLGEACEVNPPKPKLAGVSDDEPVLFVPMAAVDDVTGTVAAPEWRTLEEVRTKSYRTFRSGDVLFAKITPCMENGKSAIVPAIDNDLGFGSTEFHVLRPKPQTSARFIWHLVRQERFRREAEANMTGSVGQARVPVDFLRSYPLDLPPIDVQERLADRLDATVEAVTVAKENLADTCRAIGLFRHSVLAAACSGRLTAGWRGTDDNEDGLPDGWEVHRLGEVAEVRLGGTPSREIPDYWNGGLPWVSSGEVANARISSTRETISELGLTKSSAKLYPSGTVLIAMIGEGKTRGQAAILEVEAATNQNAAGVMPDRSRLLPEFLFQWALGKYEEHRGVGHGGNQPALNGQKVRDLVILLPPISEQAEIVRRLSRLSTVSDRVEQHIRETSSCVADTVHVIVSKAMSGSR